MLHFLRPLTIGYALLIAIALIAACDSRPRAPALIDSPVYQNNREGFRFLVPDGWIQTASSVLPPKLEGEVILVQYTMRTPIRGAMVEVLCFDEAQPSDLAEYHAGPSHGQKNWGLLEPSRTIKVHGTPAERLVYAAQVGTEKMVKEVVAFRRKQRVYSFVGLYWVADNKAPQQLRRAVESTVWKD